MSEAVQYVEIDLPQCSLEYGQAPCTAAIGVTGDRKCFNTRATCQDLPNYDEEKQTIRFAVSTKGLQPDIIAIPNIQSVSYTPPRIELGRSIGVRATLTITFKDHPFPDTGPGGDKYVQERDYIPFNRGTFWGKFQARYPFMREREVRWYIGNTQDSLESMEERIFVLDRIDGPDTNGQVRLVAKDPLSLLDDKRTLAPRQNRGAVGSPVSDTDTSVTLKPIGITALQYNNPTPYFVTLGGTEVMRVTAVNTATDTLTVQRAQKNTEAIEHSVDTRVQVALEYETETPQNILSDLLLNYVGSPTAPALQDYINATNWDSEVDEFLGGGATISYTALITEPTPVNDLCNEICQQSGISLWWDDTISQIQLQVLRRVVGSGEVYDDNKILRNTFSQRENPNKRISQTWIFYAQINPTVRDDPDNFREALVNVPTTIFADAFESPSVERIFSRWIPLNGFVIAERASNLLLTRYFLPPRTFKFEILRGENVAPPVLGTGISVAPFNIQDDTGATQEIEAQITEVLPSDATWRVTAEEFIRSDIPLLQPDPNFFPIPLNTNQNNINIKTEFDRLYPGATLQSGDIVRCEVRNNVIIGSTSITTPAIRTGTGWPSNITLELLIFANGIVAGHGGVGGLAEFRGPRTAFAADAGDGGPALLVESAITITNNGIIGGGGGGGGAAAAGSIFIRSFDPSAFAIALSGGGGGAGRILGRGGTTENRVALSGSQRTGIANLQNGANGTTTTGGAGGNTTTSIPFASFTIEATAIAGAGGGLGEAGGTASTSAFSLGNNPVATQAVSSPGQPGDAIQGIGFVNSGASALGDIRGNTI